MSGPRPASAADAAGIAACVRAAYTHYVERGSDIVGALVLIENEDGLLLDDVAVLPSLQGAGLGRRLLEHAESEARRLGHGHLDLYTHQRMTENIAMYVRYGYEAVDRRTEGGFPRVYMRKRL